jgi:hypothetical protein
MLAVSSQVWVREMLPSAQGWYTGGAVNLSGLLSWLLLLPLWATSLPTVRQRCFNTFKLVHMLWLPVSECAQSERSLLLSCMDASLNLSY